MRGVDFHMRRQSHYRRRMEMRVDLTDVGEIVTSGAHEAFSIGSLRVTAVLVNAIDSSIRVSNTSAKLRVAAYRALPREMSLGPGIPCIARHRRDRGDRG